MKQMTANRNINKIEFTAKVHLTVYTGLVENYSDSDSILLNL